MTDRISRWITTGERTPLPLFVSSFAKSAASGGNDDDEDDDEDDENDDEDDDDPDADKSDDELRAELKATRASLAKANGQSAKRRKALRERERELEEARKPKPKKKDDEDDDGPDLDTVRHEAKSEGEKAGIARAKRAEAKAALLSAGVNPDRVAKATNLIDLDDLDLDDDGLDGIDDAIEDLRKSWPELFARPRKRRDSVIGERDADGASRKPKPKTASEQAAAQLLGRSR
jgi:hypothetical protein